MDPINHSLISLSESSISHERVVLPILRVVDAEDDRVVVVLELVQVEGHQIVKIELALLGGDDLAHAFFQANLLKVVFFVGSVEHHWCVVHVPLLLHAAVHSHVSVALAVNLEGDL